VFWDADVFVLPVLAATHPTAARAIVEYRIRRLPAARVRRGERPRRRRFRGSRASTAPTSRPSQAPTGTVGSCPSTRELEEHITADVAWAAWQLSSWTGSWHLLGRRADRCCSRRPYWASRIRLDDAGRGHIDHVIGPDSTTRT